MRSIITILLLALSAPLVLAAQGSTSVGGVNEATGAEVRDSETLPGHEKVKPGECHTNGDGVKVCNTGDKDDGDFTVDPKNGDANSQTTVEAKNDAKGTVDGIDGNDTVNCANGSSVTITGTGGTVNANSGSSGSVQNTNPPGGANITINIGGGSVQVPPGSTIPFNG